MHGSGDGGWGDGACLESMVHTFTLLHATVLRCTSHSNFLTLNGNSHFFFVLATILKRRNTNIIRTLTHILSVVEIKIKKLLKRYFYPARNDDDPSKIFTL